MSIRITMATIPKIAPRGDLCGPFMLALLAGAVVLEVKNVSTFTFTGGRREFGEGAVTE